MLSIKRLVGAGMATLALLVGALATAPSASANVGDVSCLNGNLSGATSYETSTSSLCVKSYTSYNGLGSGYRVWFNNRSNQTLSLKLGVTCIGGEWYESGQMNIPTGHAGVLYFGIGLRYGCTGTARDLGNYFASKGAPKIVQTYWVYYTP